MKLFHTTLFLILSTLIWAASSMAQQGDRNAICTVRSSFMVLCEASEGKEGKAQIIMLRSVNWIGARPAVGQKFHAVIDRRGNAREVVSQLNPSTLADAYCVTTLIRNEVATLVCDERLTRPTCARKDDPTCTHVTFQWSVNDWPEAWEKPQVRQLLRGKLINGRRVWPMVNCTPINEGDRLSLNAGPREGCEKEPSAFIQVLMRN